MSASVHSPLSSEVFSSFDSLSPPPTPVAKRGCHFFPSNASTPVEHMPMFFPTSASLLSPTRKVSLSSSKNHKENKNIERSTLASLASRPTPCLRLKPRPKNMNVSASPSFILDGKKQVLAVDKHTVDQLIPMPFSQLPMVPNLSLDTGKSDNVSNLSPRKISASDPGKLPSFHQCGMHRHTTKKCNSFVARSA